MKHYTSFFTLITGKLLLLQLLLFTFNSFSQQQPYSYKIKVTYEMTYQPDSTDATSARNEFTTLYLGESQSMFCTSRYLLVDSAMESELSKGNSQGVSLGFLQANPTRGFFVIFKTNDVITTYDQAAPYLTTPSLYKYNESKSDFQWNISSDTMSIGGLLCQRATTSFAKRQWEAWFAPSIPASDGPYKFCGLPGLILNVSDSKRYWNFKLAALQNTDISLAVHFSGKTAQQLKTKELFLERKKYSRDNRFELMKIAGTHFANEADSRQRLMQWAAKDNNWIEFPEAAGK